MKRLAAGDIITVEQLLSHFDSVIASINETRRNLLAAGVTLGNDTLHDESRNLHHIWMGVLDLTADAYKSDDLLEIR